jgi:hypothetical protein
MNKGPWCNLLTQVAGGTVKPPKARQAWQQFMTENGTTVSEAVAERWEVRKAELLKAQEKDCAEGKPVKEIKQGMGFRSEVARSLFVELPEEEKQLVKERAVEEARLAREKHAEDLKKPPSKEPQDRQR